MIRRVRNDEASPGRTVAADGPDHDESGDHEEEVDAESPIEEPIEPEGRTRGSFGDRIGVVACVVDQHEQGCHGAQNLQGQERWRPGRCGIEADWWHRFRMAGQAGSSVRGVRLVTDEAMEHPIEGSSRLERVGERRC